MKNITVAALFILSLNAAAFDFSEIIESTIYQSNLGKSNYEKAIFEVGKLIVLLEISQKQTNHWSRIIVIIGRRTIGLKVLF